MESKHKNKIIHDKTARHVDFKVGDLVFLQKGPKPHKFDNRYTGPHPILEILLNENIRIEFDRGTQVVDANRLKLYKLLNKEQN